MHFKKLICYTAFIFSLFVFSCYYKPRIVFNEMNHDFGRVGQNIELKYIFKFKNTGTSTLLIKKLKAG